MPANTAMGAPYPLGTDPVKDGDNAMQALARTVATIGRGDASASPDCRWWSYHAGFTTNQWGFFYVTPAPNLATFLYAGAVHIITTESQEPYIINPLYQATPAAGPQAVFAVRRATGSGAAWVANQFIIAHVLILGY